MLDTEIEEIEGAFVRVLRKPSRRINPVKPPVNILGFDTEYTAEEILSVQLSRRRGDSEMFLIREPELSIKRFEEVLRKFSGLSKGTVYLIAHAGAAEAKFVEGFLENFKCVQINRGFHWQGDVGPFKVIVKDLYNFLPGTLGSIGKSLGFEKLSLDGIDGKPESWWKRHMDILLEKHSDVFKAYALRDAEICIEAWNQLRTSYLAKGIETLYLKTLPAAGFEDFRQNYLDLAAAPYAKVQGPKNRFSPSFGWSKHAESDFIFDGERSVRHAAMRSYQGAINLAPWFGYRKRKEPFAQFLDVISLYVAAARLTPLPNENTKWEMLTDINQIRDHEGYAQVYFEFPTAEKYPNLACKIPMFSPLVFPLKGVTWETLAQIRQAVEFGADVKMLRGWGFKPWDSEIHHSLGRFLEKEFELKSLAQKGSLEYTTHKNIAVSLIGKFAYRSEEFDTQEILDAFNDSGLSLVEFSKFYARSFRDRLKHRPRAGKTWAPEWSSLILGKSRALMSAIIREGCFHVSTDGGFFPLDAIPRIMALPEVKELESVGSGLRPESSKDNPEGLIDEAVVIRTRLYGTWFQGVPVHHAFQGLNPPKKPTQDIVFDQMLRSGIAGYAPNIHTYQTTRLSKIKDVLLKSRAERLMDEIVEDKRFKYLWDCKRKIPIAPKHLENPFAVDVETTPFETVEAAFKWHSVVHCGRLTVLDKIRLLENPNLTINQAVGLEHGRHGPGRLSKEERQEKVKDHIRKLKAQGYSEREIAKITKVPKTTVRRYLYGSEPDQKKR